MAQRGLRLLSLDGGGTRGLSTLYIVREVMSRVVLGDGGRVRPCEYFDLIGGSGLSGLCALLFVRFSYTIDEAIEFLCNLSQNLDDVENFQPKVEKGDVENAESWQKCMNEFTDPAEQLEALRQGIIDEAWEAVIKSNITDGLEQYEHMENGKFNFKSPSAEIEAGRAKAFVVSSESQGYGKHGGFSDSRRYNVPLLHRTYDCRHGKSLYTFYAVGLATVASPDIVKPGVIFPDFLTTGRHTIHNPTRLMLEECNMLWPGLRVAVLVSIGTGTFDHSNSLLNSLSSATATACLKICDENQRLAEEIERFMLPHDKALKSAYIRLNNTTPIPYYEYWAKKSIQDQIKSWLTSTRGATQCANVANVLKDDNFPTAPEDLIALASLASMLHSLVEAGYVNEAEVVADVISNFILYEAAAGEDGSFRKTMIATHAEQLGGKVSSIRGAYKNGHSSVLAENIRSEGMILNGTMAYGDYFGGGQRLTGHLQTLSDYAAGAYYFLTVYRRGDSSEMEEPRLRILLRQLSSLLNTAPEVTPQFVSRIDSLLELASLAALCEAGTAHALRGFKGLLCNGSLIRHVHTVLLNTSIKGISQTILGPIANMIALSIQMENWSTLRDSTIIKLLDSASTRVNENWSLVNLSVERCSMAKRFQSDSVQNTDIQAVCQSFQERHARAWSAKPPDMLSIAIEDGFFKLLWKLIRGENLRTSPPTNLDASPYKQNIYETHGETGLHLAAKIGYLYIMKMIIEGLGMDRCRDLVNLPNSKGQTALHLACMHRAPKEVFKLLSVLNVDVNAQCSLGRTPLHYCFPDQNMLPSIHQVVMDMIEDLSLPTISPLDMPRAYGIYGKGKPIDPRVYDFRVIINHLLWRQADMSISDDDGMTPLHLAAKQGWGDNIDIFFLRDDTDAEKRQRTCLRVRDNSGLTVLGHARRTGIKGALNGGENIIAAEMRKRAMDIPPLTTQDRMALEPQWTEVTIGKPRSPVPNRDPEYSSGPNTKQASVRSNTPVITASTQFPPHFPPPQVYQDPEVMNYGPPSEASHEPRARLSPQAPVQTWTPPRGNYGSGNLQQPERVSFSSSNSTTSIDVKQKSGFFKKFTKGK